MRRAIPTDTALAPIITREVRHWRRAFRGLLDVNDLQQEAHVVALDTREGFDPARAPFLTFYTLALRRHFARLLRRERLRALLLDEPSRALLNATLRVSKSGVSDPLTVLLARRTVDRLCALPELDQRLIAALVQFNGRVLPVARRFHWSLQRTYSRVAMLRRIIKEE